MPAENDIEVNEDYKRRNGYAANVHCQICRGAGAFHPLWPDGRPNYSKVIMCEALGCMRDSFQISRGQKTFLQAQGVSDYLKSFEKFKRRTGAGDALDAFEHLARGGYVGCRFLFCYGGTGSGKTHLAEALTIELNKRMIYTRLYAASDLFNSLKIGIETGTLERQIMGLKTLPGLVIDDFVCSDWELARMEEVIDARRRKENAITVLTTNLDTSWFEQHSPRIFSRFQEEGIGRIVFNSASDARVRGI